MRRMVSNWKVTTVVVALVTALLVSLSAGCLAPGRPMGAAAARVTANAPVSVPVAMQPVAGVPEVTLEIDGFDATNPARVGQAPGWGSLSIVVKWPPRQLQTIPSSTKVVRAEVLSGGTVLQSAGEDVAVEVTRPEGSSTSTASVRVPAGDSYQVRVRAYKNLVSRESAYLVAEGTANDVAVGANEVLNLALTLSPVGTAPEISAMVPTNGGPGTQLAIVGTAFGGPTEPQPTVTIGGSQVPVGQIQWPDDLTRPATITVDIPEAAGTGQVVITRDSFSNTSPPTFTVLQSVSIAASTSTMTAPATFQFTATAMASPSGQAVANPTVYWAVFDLSDQDPPPDPPIAEISESGLLTVRAPGTVEVNVGSGTLQATTSLTIQ